MPCLSSTLTVHPVQAVLPSDNNHDWDWLHVFVDPPVPPDLCVLPPDTKDKDDKFIENVVLVLNSSNIPTQIMVRNCQFRRIRARRMLFI
mmetsp:Transcript_5398/g.10432  ORF Transcript_5398/g.10432 Transcript_5398/m.10432 type:complete len:90 (-) Transcript_5398:440-709(-)